MQSHDRYGVRHRCAAALTASGLRRSGRHCRRSRPGYLAEVGRCWLRRFGLPALSWRVAGPHK
jgi:hypothetical protein